MFGARFRRAWYLRNVAESVKTSAAAASSVEEAHAAASTSNSNDDPISAQWFSCFKDTEVLFYEDREDSPSPSLVTPTEILCAVRNKARKQGFPDPPVIDSHLPMDFDQDDISKFQASLSELTSSRFISNGESDQVVFGPSLEILLDDGQFERAYAVLKETVIRRRFRFTNMGTLSNLLATFVRSSLNSKIMLKEREQARVFFDTVLERSTLDTGDLFEATLAKLEGLEVPLCLGLLFGKQKSLEHWQLFIYMHTYYVRKYPGCSDSFSYFMPFCSIIEFLRQSVSSTDRLVHTFHCFMENYHWEEWSRTWHFLGLHEEYYKQWLSKASFECYREHNRI